MKALLLLLAPAILLLSCNNSKPEYKEDPKPETAPAPAPVVPEKESDGTTIKVDENGVSYENKKGTSKNEVKISEDSSRIEIKTK